MGAERDAPVFRRGSNVLDYWLAHAEGFVVASRSTRVGIVKRVVVDPVRGHADRLVVRTPLLRRRRVVPAEAITAVDPAARRLQVEQPERPKPVRTRPPLGPKLRTASDRVRPLGAAAARAVAAALVWTARAGAAATVAAARHARTAGVWLRPRVKARAGEARVAALSLGAAAAESGGRLAGRIAQQARQRR
jgi:hypothetical protein